MRTKYQTPLPARQHKDATGNPHAGRSTVLAQAIHDSSGMVAQRQLIGSVQRSPRMNAQHKELAILSGQQAQLDEEDEKRPLQAKSISAQTKREAKR